MVTEIRIYFEGDKKLRPGFHAFLSSVRDMAGHKRIGFQLVAGGNNPVDDFKDALQDHPSAFVVLLKDSEGPAPDRLSDIVTPDGQQAPPVRFTDDQIHLMVQAMEAWFLADIDALSEYYGHGFRPDCLPGYPNVEKAPKDDVLAGLKDATAKTQKGEYHKTKHAPDLLAGLDPQTVRRRAPACNRLFQILEQRVTS